MSKNQKASGITNIISYDNSGNISFVSGSTTLMSVSSSGAVTLTNTMSGGVAVSSSYAYTASSATNAFNSISASYAYTASSAINAFSASKSISSSYSDTSSYANNFTVMGNLTVFGTQSVQYITSSQLNVANNVITVNVGTPGVRFGGLSVYDSGSTAGATGSLYWDSFNNNWVYQQVTGSTYTGGMLISGPRNTGGLGNEVGTTNNALMKGMGGDHITSSAIFEVSGSVTMGLLSTNLHSITGSISVTGSGTFTNYILSGPNTVVQTAGVASNFVNNAFYNGTDWRFLSTGYASAVSEDTSDGSIGFYTSPSGAVNTTASFTRKAIITNSGSLGLGNNAPSSVLNPSSFPVLAIKSTTVGAYPSHVLQYVNGQEAGITLASSLYIDVAGDSTGTNNNIIFRTTSTNSTSTPLVERVRISAAGNVGIGNTSPDRLIVIQGSGESWIRSTTTATSTQSWLFGQDGTRKGFEVYDATVSATRFFISPTSGNVGIGSSSPSANLHVNAQSGLLTKEILIVQGGGSPSGNYGFSVQANNGDKIFYTDNLTYNVYAGLAGGKFFVNTTTSLTNNRMHVGLSSTESFKAGSWEIYTYAINNAFIMENAYFDGGFKYRISGYANAFYSDGASGAEVRVAEYGGTGNAISFKNAATFAPNGSVYNYSNTTAWQQTSDVKIKENIISLTSGLDTLLNLRPVTFDYKEEFSNSVNWEDNDRLNNVGFIAQEFEEVFPKYVGSSERKINGEFKTLKNIDTSHLVAYLVKAIQELKAENDNLKSRVEALEAN